MSLFRRSTGANDGAKAVRVYYASDIHGSEALWRKFLNAAGVYKSNVIIMGGDVTGKAVIPLAETDGGFQVELFGKREQLHGETEVEQADQRIRANGMYPHRMAPDEIARVSALSVDQREDWFAEVMLQTFDRWMELAEERLASTDVRCFLMPGNDDPAGVDTSIERAVRVEAFDDRIVEFDGHQMISLGYSNRTPFDSPRELDEDELYQRVDTLAAQIDDHARSIFNLHVPPYDSTLDTAAELDDDLSVDMSGSEQKQIPVGST